MSVTRPWTSSPIETRSPIRIGWVIASRMPETRFAITWRPAKPMMIPSTAVEARMPVAKRLIEVNWLRASATPIRMIARKSRRRIRRSRVRASRESSPVSSRVAAWTARPISRRSTTIAIEDGDHDRDRRRDLVAVRLPEGLVRGQEHAVGAVFNR